jgi:uncharacterized cupin superfamily protein
MPEQAKAAAIAAVDVPTSQRQSRYPQVFAARVQGRVRRALGDFFGLTNFGINLTRLAPGAMSALRHCHSRQDEFIYVVAGEPMMVTDAGETQLKPGMCAGFRAGSGDAHHLINRTQTEVLYLEIGDRGEGDHVEYPDDDLRVEPAPGGGRRMLHKDGTPY